jgi:hypothetical protein
MEIVIDKVKQLRAGLGQFRNHGYKRIRLYAVL